MRVSESQDSAFTSLISSHLNWTELNWTWEIAQCPGHLGSDEMR